MKKRGYKKGAVAISEILILVVAIVAFGYLVGEEFRLVSGAEELPIIQAAPGKVTNIPTPVNKVKTSEFTQDIVKEGGSAITSTNSEDTISRKLISGLDGVNGGEIYQKDGRWFNSEDVDITDALGKNDCLNTKGNILSKCLSSTSGGSGKEGFDPLGKLMAPATTGFGHIVQSLSWAGIVYYASGWVASFLTDDENLQQAIQTSLAVAVGVGRFATGFSEGGVWEGVGGKFGSFIGAHPYMTGIAAGAIVFLLMYKKESTEIIKFECKPWDAPTGGDDCEKCNNQAGGLPCSEYQCRALGQACELRNEGDEEAAVCVNVHRGDVNQPVITPWEDALTPDFSYTPNNAISPPDRGVFIEYDENQEGCIPAFTPLTFGIETDEPARCKMDYVRRENMDDMRFFFGGSSLFSYNHTQSLNLPGPNQSGEGPVLENGGEFDLYVKCTDAMGNENEGDFLFSFCVDEGPDTTPPLIVNTNLINGMPVAFNTTSVDVELYTNEPADCRWSRRDQSYPEMENEMQCSRSVYEMNAQMLYKCAGTLDGIQDREENYYYFRCEDKPLAPENERNVNKESYEFMIQGTQPLYIDDVEPNGTIRDSTNVVTVKLEVETRAGYNEGQASCYFAEEEEGEYILFSDTDNEDGYSSQELYLPEGNYEYFIRCIDLGGNADNTKIEFEVETDNNAPRVVRAYQEDNNLKIITDEEDSLCVYDVTDCAYNFEEGNEFNADSDGKNHYTDWNEEKTYYIKCSDDFGNMPLPNQCSIIVRPFKVTEGN